MNSPQRTGDVVIVGGGVIGTSAAYHLARDGFGVTLLEANRIASGTSSMNAGAVSLATKQPGLSLQLAQLSWLRYEHLAEELGFDIEYERCGLLVAAETAEDLKYLQGLGRRQRAAGLRVELLGPRRIREVNPLLAVRMHGGSYRAEDAQLNPQKLTQGFAAAARRYGARLLEGMRVTSITLRSGRVRGVIAGGEPLAARWILNCGGYLARDIGAMVGIDHVVVPRVGHQAIFDAPPTLPRTKLVTAGQLRAKQHPPAASRNVFFSYTHKPRRGQAIIGISNVPLEQPWWPWTRTMSLDPEREPTREIRGLAEQWMPALKDLAFIGTYAAVRPHSSSGPVIGAMGPQGYVAAVGHGGDGVSLAAVTGEVVASIVRGEVRDALEYVQRAPVTAVSR